MKKKLVIVDIQNDFVMSGFYAGKFDCDVIMTRDTHIENQIGNSHCCNDVKN